MVPLSGVAGCLPRTWRGLRGVGPAAEGKWVARCAAKADCHAWSSPVDHVSIFPLLRTEAISTREMETEPRFKMISCAGKPSFLTPCGEIPPPAHLPQRGAHAMAHAAARDGCPAPPPPRLALNIYWAIFSHAPRQLCSASKVCRHIFPHLAGLDPRPARRRAG